MMTGYILSRDPAQKDWKSGTVVTVDVANEQHVADEDHKFPFLELLWFERPQKANEFGCWKVKYANDKLAYSCQYGICLTVVTSFTVLERVTPDKQFDGEMPIMRTGKAVFHHGFLMGSKIEKSIVDGGGFDTFVYCAWKDEEPTRVRDLDAYFAAHSPSVIVGDQHAIRQ